MKGKITIIVFAVISICLHSCFPDAPLDAQHPENYFKDASALGNWINYCYREFDDQYCILNDADDFVCNEPSDYLAGTRSAAAQTWDWSVLRQANSLIDNVRFCQDKDAAARYVAEAEFFRSLFYFNKVRQWGGVPYYKGTVKVSDAPKSANSREYVMGEATDRMLEAAEELTGEVFDLPVRINRWVALGFLARASLFEGTFLKYSGEEGWEEYLNQAVSACGTIIESGLFEVFSAQGWKPANAYRNLFAMETMSPKEALLVRLYNTDDCISELDRIYGEYGVGATQRFVNHYQIINGASISTRPGYLTEEIAQVFQARDPRLSQTLWSPGCKEADTSEPVGYDERCITGYQPIKFRKSADASKYSASFPLLRYSEILLTYAEAKAELGTIRQADLDMSVNLVRARVGMPALSLADANRTPDSLLSSFYPNVPASANKGIILEIRRERTVELALEGQRIWDILRWHEGSRLGNREAPINGVYTAGKGYKVAFGNVTLPEEEWDEDRDYLWPVPASEFAVPGCRLKQNYGY